jgi:flagella basal body P-ring formation protein FlgA
VVAGQPLSAADIGPPVMVAKGQTVVMVVETPGLYLAVQGLALSPGGRDDVIQVMNPLSRAVVAARVTSPGRAVIAPGSTPLVQPGATPRNPEVAN